MKEAMDKAIQNPTEDTIFQLSSITEANAFKAGVREVQQVMSRHMQQHWYGLQSVFH